MSRMTVALDRVVTAVLGVAFIAAGVLVLGWYYTWWSGMPDVIDNETALRITNTSWWPWTLAAAAVVLLLLGLRWLLAHTPGRRVSELRLPGSGSGGRLEVDASSAVKAACSELQERSDVRSAQGVVRRDRGQLLIDIRATLEPRTDLRQIAGAVDDTATTLVESLERPDLYCSVRLDVARRRGKSDRVR